MSVAFNTSAKLDRKKWRLSSVLLPIWLLFTVTL